MVMDPLIKEENVRVPCIDNDGTLGATIWRKAQLHCSTTSTQHQQHAIVVIFASAMGVPRHFYRKLAQHIVAQSKYSPNLAAIAFDWRGTFDSKFPDNLRNKHISLWHWGTYDLDSVFEYVRDNMLANVPVEYRRIMYVGHSLSGQLVSMMRHARSLDAIACVASQSGYFNFWRRSVNKIDNRDPPAWSILRPSTWFDWWYWDILFTWYVKVPLACALFGKIPVMNTPQQVARQWASACKKPHYIWDQFSESADFQYPFNVPVMWYGVEGDYYAPRAASEWIFRLYCPSPAAVIQYLPTVLAIKDDPLLHSDTAQGRPNRLPLPPKQRMIHIGGDDGRKMGHFGFQRVSGNSLLLWDHLTAFLDKCAQGCIPQAERPTILSKL